VNVHSRPKSDTRQNWSASDICFDVRREQHAQVLFSFCAMQATAATTLRRTRFPAIAKGDVEGGAIRVWIRDLVHL